MMTFMNLMKMKKVTKKIKEYASIHNVPIVTDEGLEFILSQIKTLNIKKVLEIGTAIGYSAISFTMNGCSVTTIERNNDMFKTAINNVNELGLQEQITLINGDALLIDDLNEEFDMIFIDAAKAQYEKFFNKYKKNLSNNGIIITDNLNFHNLDVTKVSRSTRQLIGKINKFKDFLENNKEFNTKFYDIGDGMSVSVKNEKNNNNI